MINLDNILRGEVLREYKSNKLDTILITIEKGREDRDRDTLVDGVPRPRDIKLVSVKNILSVLKERKKGSKILIIGKPPYPVDYNNLLIDTEVSGS